MTHSAGKPNHTPGPYFFREYAQDADDIKSMRSLGLQPTRMLTNEGQVALMAGTGDDVKRIALIDCQTRYKRGEGYKTECAERDANAALFAAAPDLVKALEAISQIKASADKIRCLQAIEFAAGTALEALAQLTATPAERTV